jgi:hypothetical protein
MPIAVWLVASSSSEGLINADRFLGRTGLASGMSCVFADNCKIRNQPKAKLLDVRAVRFSEPRRDTLGRLAVP